LSYRRRVFHQASILPLSFSIRQPNPAGFAGRDGRGLCLKSGSHANREPLSYQALLK